MPAPRPDMRVNGDEMRRPMLDIDDVMAKLESENPEEYARLLKLKQKSRGAFIREIRNRLPMPEMMSPEARRLEGECFELSRQYKLARTEGEREAIKKELTVAVEQATDALIRDMKARLKQMEQQLQVKEKNRDAIIRKRLESLLDRTKKAPARNNRKMVPPPMGDEREDEAFPKNDGARNAGGGDRPRFGHEGDRPRPDEPPEE